MAQRVIVIDLGQQIFDGSLKDLTAKINPEKQISIIFNQTPPAALLQELGKLVAHEGLFYKYNVPRAAVSKVAASLYATGLIVDLSIEDPPLEDIMGELFTAGARN